MLKHIGFSISLTITAILAVSVTSYAQDQNTESQNTGDQTETPALEQKNILKPTTTKERYFLGNRQQITKQSGPKLSAPKSIIPQPFIPSGSIRIPAPIKSDDNPVQGGNNIATLSQEQEGNQSDIGLNPELPQDAEQTIQNNQNDGTNPDSTQSSANTFFEEGDLKAIDPSSVIVPSDAGGFDNTFWHGYDRAGFIKRLSGFIENSSSPAMNDIARKIALSSTDIPETDNPVEIDKTVQIRLELLSSKGNVDDYQTLIENLPKDHDWSNLAREFAQSHLIASRLTDACDIAETQRQTDNSAYWLRLSAFCEAAQGNRSAVDFQLGILEEVVTVEPTFYRLIDHILIEAEENTSGTVRPDDQSETLNGALEINVLEAAMVRLARIQVSEFKLENVNPMAVGMMLSVPSITKDAKMQLIHMALQQGWLETEDFESFYRSFSPSIDEQQAALSFAANDNEAYTVDAALANLIAVGDDSTIKMTALENAWLRASQQQTAVQAGQVFAELTSSLPIAASFNDKAALLARLDLLAGNTERGQAWVRTLRTRAANNDQAADSALKNIWPLMVAALGEQPTFAQFKIWWDTQAETSNRYERANLLLSTLEALGISVPDEAWLFLEKGPATLNGTAPSPALWRAFLIAVQNNDKPAALNHSFRLLSPSQNGQLSASLIGSVLSNLKALGFHKESKKLAIETLINQGL
jgi:hypothetical protein